MDLSKILSPFMEEMEGNDCNASHCQRSEDMDGKRRKREDSESVYRTEQGVCEDAESCNRLDLLVQADAILMEKKQERQNASEKSAHLNSELSGTNTVWFLEEEEYAASLIYHFLKGALPIKRKTLLLDFLAKELECSPNRILKKLNEGTLADQHSSENLHLESYRGKSDAFTLEERGHMSLKLSKLRTLFEARKRADARNRSATNIVRRRPLIVRTGFLTEQEEIYTKALVESFQAGVLILREGTRLTEFLCSKLRCNSRDLSLKLAHIQWDTVTFNGPIKLITYHVRSDTHERKHKYNEIPAMLDVMEEAYLESIAEWRRSTGSISPTADEYKPMRRRGIATVAMYEPARFTKASRSGPWSKEEEAYSAKLIRSFCDGALDLAENTTLRSFLASRLGCNPMRVSKKLATGMIADLRIPKRSGSSMFVRKTSISEEDIAQTEICIRDLYEAFLSADTNKRKAVPQTRDELDAIASAATVHQKKRVRAKKVERDEAKRVTVEKDMCHSPSPANHAREEAYESLLNGNYYVQLRPLFGNSL